MIVIIIAAFTFKSSIGLKFNYVAFMDFIFMIDFAFGLVSLHWEANGR